MEVIVLTFHVTGALRLRWIDIFADNGGVMV